MCSIYNLSLMVTVRLHTFLPYGPASGVTLDSGPPPPSQASHGSSLEPLTWGNTQTAKAGHALETDRRHSLVFVALDSSYCEVEVSPLLGEHSEACLDGERKG